MKTFVLAVVSDEIKPAGTLEKAKTSRFLGSNKIQPSTFQIFLMGVFFVQENLWLSGCLINNLTLVVALLYHSVPYNQRSKLNGRRHEHFTMDYCSGTIKNSCYNITQEAAQ